MNMCGIFGYIGNEEKEVALMANKALRELEYRGYDSWGIAADTGKEMFALKAVGKISLAPLDVLVVFAERWRSDIRVGRRTGV